MSTEIEKLHERIAKLEADHAALVEELMAVTAFGAARIERQRLANRMRLLTASRSPEAFAELDLSDQRVACRLGDRGQIIAAVLALPQDKLDALFPHLERPIVDGLRAAEQAEQGFDRVVELSMREGAWERTSTMRITGAQKAVLESVGCGIWISVMGTTDQLSGVTYYEYAPLTFDEKDRTRAGAVIAMTNVLPLPRLEAIRTVDPELDRAIREGDVHVRDLGDAAAQAWRNWRAA